MTGLYCSLSSEIVRFHVATGQETSSTLRLRRGYSRPHSREILGDRMHFPLSILANEKGD
jgi:hypothetical protein